MNDIIQLPALPAIESIAFGETITQSKENALATATLVHKVTSPSQEKLAADTMRDLKAVERTVEDARKTVKAPILEIGRKIDSAASVFILEVQGEHHRIRRLVENYQAELLRQKQEAERKAREELARIERERAEAERAEQRRIEEARRAELAKARDEQERAAAEERAQRAAEEAQARAAQQAQQAQAAVLTALPTPVKTAGMAVAEEWDFEVKDALVLANCHPEFVTITPKVRDIKAALKEGVPFKGIRAWKAVRASVRRSPEAKPIDV